MTTITGPIPLRCRLLLPGQLHSLVPYNPGQHFNNSNQGEKNTRSGADLQLESVYEGEHCSGMPGGGLISWHRPDIRGDDRELGDAMQHNPH